MNWKSTPRTPEGERRGTRIRLADPEPGVEVDPECPYEQIMGEPRELQYHNSIRDGILKTIGDMVGCSIRSKLMDVVLQGLTKTDRIRKLEENEKKLNKEMFKL